MVFFNSFSWRIRRHQSFNFLKSLRCAKIGLKKNKGNSRKYKGKYKGKHPKIQDILMKAKNKKKQEQREKKHRINSADYKNTNTPKISNQAKKL